MDGDLAHAVDHIVEVVGQSHAIGNVETEDKDVVQKLVDVIDDRVTAMLVVDDAGQVFSTSLTEVSCARDSRFGKLEQQLRKPFILRLTEESPYRFPNCAHLAVSGGKIHGEALSLLARSATPALLQRSTRSLPSQVAWRGRQVCSNGEWPKATRAKGRRT